ncbi:O-acyltransferase like protein-like [Hyposmocoma kahamanoa]|uniref:O-acyltransferase like protein-like n=1 Tax=Hyposmocoma kahamanoa TaxID=1477025 RepID=UPI000E6D802E|nr:O-acyltransferase like protein-like [Hyposmocoma kahamanoa]
MISIRVIFVVFCAFVLTDKVGSDQNNRAIDIEWEEAHPPFDPNIYEEVLDPELCAKQIEYLTMNDTLLMITFIEAGPRMPRGILQGNLIDLGNYHQCLGINREIDDMVIDGKYCQINIGLSDLANIEGTTELDNVIEAFETIKDEVNLYNILQNNLEILNGIKTTKTSRTDLVDIGALRFSVAICLPKPCSTRPAISNLFGTELVNFEEQFCRFKNDKPWAPGLYVAIVVFSIIGLLAILGTSYDIWNTQIKKRDPKSLNAICLSFSVYTNSRRLVTYKPVRGSLECVDGIRAITITWIVIGHSFSGTAPLINGLEFFQWGLSFSAIWLTSADIGVDTFFMLSGLMIVYTTVGKISSMKLLKKLHLFYLSRLVRLYPLLATTVLLQAGVAHYMYDGAMWSVVAAVTTNCRRSWWLTLLYVQNFFRPMCLSSSWYLAIDMQLHILSPLILIWVLSGKKNLAWSALVVGLLISLTASSTYNFLNNFIGTNTRLVPDPVEFERYSKYYYFSTLTRCSPFFVGMCFGYFIHVWRENNIRLTRILNCILWIVTLAVLWLAFYATEPMKKIGYDNQIYDNFVNSFMRPVWALGVGWLVLACAEGYGGPINWFLSLRMWKLPSRLSYAIYLLHEPVQIIIVGAATQLLYFSVWNFFYIFCGQFVIYFIVSFIFTILVDSPCSTLFKVFLGNSYKKTDSGQRGDENTSKNRLAISQQQNELLNVQNKDAT